MSAGLYFTRHNGEHVTREYLARRVSAYLSRKFRTIYSRHERCSVVREMASNPKWLRVRNGETVGSVCRAAEDRLFDCAGFVGAGHYAAHNPHAGTREPLGADDHKHG